MVGLSVYARFDLIRMGSLDVFQQCSMASVILKEKLPRGIQLFKAGQHETSWYFSVFGSCQREVLEDGILFSRMQTGMASVWVEDYRFFACHFPKP